MGVLPDRVEKFRRRAVHHTVYMCGPAGGEEEFWDLLDVVIQIAVDDDVLRHRLTTRTNNSYGKGTRRTSRRIVRADVPLGVLDSAAALDLIEDWRRSWLEMLGLEE